MRIIFVLVALYVSVIAPTRTQPISTVAPSQHNLPPVANIKRVEYPEVKKVSTQRVKPKVALNGSKESWLRQSNIPESDWGYVDWLVTRESGWNPLAQNPTSTAFGLKQFLNSTWATVGCVKSTDPVYQLNCGHKYVLQRYGSWPAAQSFWSANHWY